MGAAASDPIALHVAILGPLQVHRGTELLDLGGSKQRTLLAALALEENRTVSDGELLTILWGNDAPEGATDALRVHVHRLRRTIEGSSSGDHSEAKVLMRTPTGYSLVVTTDQLDVGRFRVLLKEARAAVGQGDEAQALHLFDAATALWRGPILADVGDSSFVASHRSRLDKMRLEALEDRFDVSLRVGRHFENINAIESLAEEYPLRERLQGQLLLALYRCGRQAEASDAYQRTRRRLADELGMEPGPDLQATFREILRQEVAPVSAGAAPTLHMPELLKRRSNLPSELSSFVGREGQIRELAELLVSNRHVTLVGPGGIGKTRLALRVSASLFDEYPDGVWLVDLATVIDAETLPRQVLAWLGFRDRPDLTSVATLVAILEQSELLLVLDNCEHLVDATAELIQTLLRSCPHVSILATSRERLNCDGEQAWSVPALETPGADRALPVEGLLEHDAVRLFVERAREARRSFALTPDNARAVTQLCSRLDGIPLAIELAAARSAGMSPGQLLEQLDNRFRLIAGSRRASVSRHRTMRETIDWSHRLLAAEEQLLFQRLSVFAGSFDVAAAEVVCGDDDLESDSVLDVLTKLVDKSLVAYSDAIAGEGRYRMLETVRQFAQEKLAGDANAVRIRTRHANHYLKVGETFEYQYSEGRFGELVRRLDAEYANARAALEWAEGADVELFLGLAATWWHYWWLQGLLTEGRVWLDRALASTGGSLRSRARVLAGKGRLLTIQGDTLEAQKAFTEGMASALQAGDQTTVAVLHNSLGIMAYLRGATAEAESHFHHAVAVWESRNASGELIAVYGNLGEMCFLRGEFDQARARYASAIRIGVEDSPAMVTVLVSLANLERHVGDYRAAWDYATEGLRVAHRGEFVTGRLSSLEAFAFLAAAEDQPFRCAVLSAAAAILAARFGVAPDGFPDRSDAEQCLEEVRRKLDGTLLAQAQLLAAAMTLDEVVEFALSGGDRRDEMPVKIA